MIVPDPLPVAHVVGLTERELVGDWEGEAVTELDALPLRDTEMHLVTLNVREVVTVEEEEMVPLRDWLGDIVKEVEAVLLADTQAVKDALRLLEGEALRDTDMVPLRETDGLRVIEGDGVCVGDTLDERVDPVNRRGYKRKIIHQRIELAMVLLSIGLPCSDCDCRAELYE